MALNARLLGHVNVDYLSLRHKDLFQGKFHFICLGILDDRNNIPLKKFADDTDCKNVARSSIRLSYYNTLSKLNKQWKWLKCIIQSGKVFYSSRLKLKLISVANDRRNLVKVTDANRIIQLLLRQICLQNNDFLSPLRPLSSDKLMGKTLHILLSPTR